MRARTTIALGAVLALGVVPMLPGPRAARPAPCPARSSDWLNLLPDGAEKRQFIIDCTNCHQFGVRQALPDGVPRAGAEWEAAVTRMVSYAGATTRFPIISAGRDPAATARWLTAALGARTPAATCDAPLPAARQVRGRRHQHRRRQVVDRVIARVLEGRERHALAAPRQSTDEEKVHVRPSGRRRP